MSGNGNGFFTDGAELGSGSEEMLLKTLFAGTGANAAEFTGGRALQPESCEATLINVMREQQDDFKLMNTIKKTPVKSTVHQYNLRTDIGDADMGFVAEAGEAPANLQDIRRVTRDMKFIQKRGEVTEQALVVDAFEDAFETEKVAATLSVLKTAEKHCFHGDSAVVPKQFDGFLAQVRNAPADKRNLIDARGRTIAAMGENIFTDMAELIADRGGEANKVFYPLVLGADIQALCRDRLRFGSEDRRMTAVFDTYPTLFGDLSIAGSAAGPDKLFFPKGAVKPSGDPRNLPNRPASVSVAAAPGAGSQFAAADAGVYMYEVHAVNEYGVSDAATCDPVAVAAGETVRIEIAAAAVNPGTGFVICRSMPNGDVTKEMVRVGREEHGPATVAIDANADLPGTAEMLFITERKMQAVVEFFQLLPMRLYRMFPTHRLTSPFVMALWGTPNMKAPHWCGSVRNIAYKGGFYG